MAIQKLTLKNFKRFDQLELDLSRNITLLMGPNSSGKSSVIKSILALKQTASPSNEHEVLSAQGEYVDLGVYKDYVHNHDTSKKISIGININAQLGVYGGYKSTPGQLTFTFAHDFATEQSKIVEIELTSEQPQKTLIKLVKKKTRDSFSLHLEESFSADLLNSIFKDAGIHIDKYINTWNKGVSTAVVDRYQINPIENATQQPASFVQRIPTSVLAQVIGQQLRDFDKNFFYLGPLRRSPSRSYNRTSHLLSVGPNGEHTPSVLANLYARAAKERGKEKSNNNRIDQLNNWVNIIFPGTKVESKTAEELVKVEFTRSTNQKEVITDVGFGFSQVLPILVQLAVMPEQATILIEQPELHLHPSAQTKLAEIFADAANSKKKLIIETHSEHLVRGLQVCISNRTAKKGPSKSRIKHTDISIQYVPRHPERVRIIEIDEFGELQESWPSGFFDEAYNSSFKILHNKIDVMSEREANKIAKT